MRRLFSAVALLSLAAAAIAGFSASDMLPLDDDAIQYTNGAVNDPVSTLQQRID